MAYVLMTGGAGNIGDQAGKALRSAGHTPITFENQAAGKQDPATSSSFVLGNLLDRAQAVFARPLRWRVCVSRPIIGLPTA